MDSSRKRPFFVALLSILFCGQACVLFIFAFGFLFVSGAGRIEYYGSEVAIADVRFEILAQMIGGIAILAYVGPALWRGNSRARFVVLAFVVLAAAMSILLRQNYKELPLDLAFVGLVAWYFYAKPNVTLFFAGT